MQLGWLLVVCACGSSGSAPSASAGSGSGASSSVSRPAPTGRTTADGALPLSQADVVQLALGGAYSCALHADGAVSCWGRNAQRQLGMADPRDQPVPVAAWPPSDAIQIAASLDRTCVLGKAGGVSCWGRVDRSASDVPVSISTPPVAQIRDTCVRTRTGDVACWTYSDVLERVAGVAGARDMASRGSQGCAVVGDGNVACWGYADLRDRFSEHLAAATPVDGVTGAVQVAAGEGFACALLRDHHVSCWGINYDGQLGLGRVEPKPPPSKFAHPPVVFGPGMVVGIDDATAVVAGASYACALRTGGTVACWGHHPFGALAAPTPVATPVDGLTGVTALAASGGSTDPDTRDGHACALRGRREVACWGTGTDGQLGNGWSAIHSVPREVPGLSDAHALSTNARFTHCALHGAGRLACWGFEAGLTGVNFTGAWALYSNQPGEAIDVAELPPIADTAGDPVDTRGVVWELARDRRQIVRKRVPPSSTASHRCAVARSGRLWCGRDRDPWIPGAIDPPPIEVPAIRDAVAVADGAYRTCALRKTGTITCWFGDDDGLDVNKRFDVPVVSDAIQLAVGSGLEPVDCAIRKDHSVWCWRWPHADTSGGGAPPYVAPVLVPAAVGIDDAVAVAVGADAACAVRAGGEVACWGRNQRGQLGDGTTLSHDRPAPVRDLRDATAIALGAHHACALRRTGHVACWGDTTGGAVGTFATAWIEPPVAVAWP